MNRDLLIDELRRDEGVKYTLYKDTAGNWTIGVGHNVSQYSLPPAMHHALTGGALSDDEVSSLLSADIDRVVKECSEHFDWYEGLTDARQRVICNMVFNLGLSRFLGFKRLLLALENGNFAGAAHEMEDSAWADQVGMRAIRLCRLMVEG